MVGNRNKQSMASLEPARAEVGAGVRSKADQSLTKSLPITSTLKVFNGGGVPLWSKLKYCLCTWKYAISKNHGSIAFVTFMCEGQEFSTFHIYTNLIQRDSLVCSMLV